MFTPAAKAQAEKLGLRKGRANLEEFADTLQALATADRNIIAVTSDSRGSGKLAPFGKALPKQIVEVGIAEQNLVGITAGLAACGKKAFGVSPSCFLTARSLEQIKNDVCYSNVPAVLVGISAGVSYGALGSTHHSLHDFAVLRAIHNVTIIAPADNFETREAVRYAAAAKRPVFLRFGKAAMLDLAIEPASFEPGRARVVFPVGGSLLPTSSGAVASKLAPAHDVAFLASGETVVHALLAAAALAEQGVSARVLSFHTIKPLDTAAVIAAGRECRAIMTVEEHMVAGGLGEAVASTLLEAGLAPHFKRIGFPDEDTVTGAQADLFRHYGISMEGLTDAALALLQR
ncbi:MAG: transketolase family protein [Opitutae bacterium]|nr:transketolase family protein [Opitutae bacterium]